MMKRILLATAAVFTTGLFVQSHAAAQPADGYTAGPGLGDGKEDTGEFDEDAPSPAYTQDRTFGNTRFWKLDKGHYETEVWWRARDPRGEDNAYNVMQLELEIGLTERIQLDLYENLTDKDGEWTREGSQIEARIAIDPVYGRTPLNPVIYLEWHPLHLGPARAEGRLLLGDAIIGDKLFGAINLFYEQNVTKSSDGMGGKVMITNPEAGFTGAASYAVIGQRLRAGAEVKFALEKEQFSDEEWETQLLVGPNLSVRVIGERLKFYGTVLFGVTDDAKAVDATLIAASAF